MENAEKGRLARFAVEEVLLPSLKDSAAIFGHVLATKCGADDLFAATEAVSLLVRRYLTQHSLHSVLMRRNGDVVAYGSEDVVITAWQLAVEVARFTELWEDNEVADSELKPSMEAVAMVLWLWMAMAQQPYLLVHFITTATGNQDLLLLTEVAPQDRVDDPRQRWSRTK